MKEKVLDMRRVNWSVIPIMTLLGFIPFLTGLVVSNFCVYLAGMLLVGGGIGDILVFNLLRSIPKNAAVIDHPDKVGFYYTVF